MLAHHRFLTKLVALLGLSAVYSPTPARCGAMIGVRTQSRDVDLQDKVHELLEHARALRSVEAYDEALAVCAQAIEFDPDSRIACEAYEESLRASVLAKTQSELSTRGARPGFLYGRVVDDRDGRGLAGFTVAPAPRRRSSACTTDDEGFFALPHPERRVRGLRLEPREGWSVEPAYLALGDAASRGDEGSVFAVREHRSAPLVLRIIDEETREPVPFFAFEIRAVDNPDAPGEAVVSDENGRCESRRAYREGHWRLELDWSEGGGSRGVDHRVFAPELGQPARPFTIRVGPTFTLDLDLPEGVLVSELRAGPGYRSPWESSSLNEQRLRAGAKPWVRFQQPLSFDPKTFWVADQLGFWHAQVTAPQGSGVWTEPVTVALRSVARLDLQVLDEAGEPVRLAWIDVMEGPRPKGIESDPNAGLPFLPGVRQLSCHSDLEGRLELRWLEGGPFFVRVGPSTLGLEAQEFSMNLVPGRLSTKTVVLKRFEGAGTVSGYLTSQTGGFHEATHVSLHSRARRWSSRQAEVSWGLVGERYIGRFEIPSVPPGRYQVQLTPDSMQESVLDRVGSQPSSWEEMAEYEPERPRSTYFAWTPELPVLELPGDVLEFHCLDETPLCDYRVSARDSVTGEPLEEMVLYRYDSSRNDRDSKWIRADEPAISNYPTNRPLRWAVLAPGRAPVFGDENAFVGSGSERTVEVDLQPGWGRVFRVLGDDGAPLEGASVLLDGVEAGRTGADGALIAMRAEKPKGYGVVLEGWELPPLRVIDPGRRTLLSYRETDLEEVVNMRRSGY